MMRTVFSLLAGVVAMVAMTASPASAQAFDERIRFTFTAPVAVPGAVLPAGEYVFRLPDPNSNRKVIQVLSGDMKTVHAMFFVNEILRGTEAASDQASLGEAPRGTPRSVEGMWNQNSVYGRGFLYGPGEASWDKAKAPATGN